MRKVSKRAANRPPSFHFDDFSFVLRFTFISLSGAVAVPFPWTSAYLSSHIHSLKLIVWSPRCCLSPHSTEAKREHRWSQLPFPVVFSHISYQAAAASCFCFLDCCQHCLLAHTKAIALHFSAA